MTAFVVVEIVVVVIRELRAISRALEIMEGTE